MNLTGIMQERLLPPIEDKVQAHPGELWRDRFSLFTTISLFDKSDILDQRPSKLHLRVELQPE
jgi:hypothetical protein